ncbi:hypothetical protein [Fluviicola sp.]|uniref:hypothetical protein n=1 Tax=Fluviicola sp. TaxID=1917219 RepID=UPI0031CF4753
METNWNQLIERYLQNELSEEGKIAFEQELNTNPELREELEMHQLIQSAAKRASQRTMIRQTGKLYLRNLRIKQFTIGIVGTAIAVVGIIYWVNTKNSTKQTAENTAVETSKEQPSEWVCRAYQINHQSNQPGGKSSLIQPTDWQTNDGTNTRFTSAVGRYSIHTRENGYYGMVTATGESAEDSVAVTRPTVAVLGYTKENSKSEVESQMATTPAGKNMLWMQKYDSVGKFNDLYCGYALVMDKSKFGFVDPEGKIFIPLIYDQLVVTTNIKSSKQKNKRQKKKVLYIPKRSGKDVKDCEETNGKPAFEVYPAEKEEN